MGGGDVFPKPFYNMGELEGTVTSREVKMQIFFLS